jgi:hypothetical protein
LIRGRKRRGGRRGERGKKKEWEERREKRDILYDSSGLVDCCVAGEGSRGGLLLEVLLLRHFELIYTLSCLLCE